jgi:hypothetical protein
MFTIQSHNTGKAYQTPVSGTMTVYGSAVTATDNLVIE